MGSRQPMKDLKVGIVVPTLGNRIEYLNECLISIRNAGDVYVSVVAPNLKHLRTMISANLVDQWVSDPGTGLAAAINVGIRSLPANIKIVNWLGDDDSLTVGSLENLKQTLIETRAEAVFGICDYVDESGQVFWTSTCGPFATKLISFGPNKIPQPGALFWRSSFDKVGGLDPSLGWAFDQDLFMKLLKIGQVAFVPYKVAFFRWHADSLSAGQQSKSVAEARLVRLRHAPRILYPFGLIWEFALTVALKLLPNTLSRAKSFTEGIGND